MNYCSECDKIFSSYKSLWIHNKNSHKRSTNHICKYCSNKYSNKSNLNRHEKKCKKQNIQKTNEENKEPIENNQFNDKGLDNTINSNDYQNIIKILVDKLGTNTNSQTSNNAHSHNTNNTENSAYSHNTNTHNTNTNNTNTQNIITIVPLGNENVIDTLTAQEQINILKQKNKALEAIIKTVHFNKKYPQFQNIAIDDKSTGYKYDRMLKKFKEIPKDELLMDLIENRISDIYDLNNENKQNISQKTHKYINSYIDMFNLDHVINQNMNNIESHIMTESQPMLINKKIKLKIKNK
jgi:hypothetical protein